MLDFEIILVGRVERKQLTKGSRTFIANVLNTEDGKELVLRQSGKSALEDPELDALNGKHIKGIGSIKAYTFLLSSFELQ